MAENTQSDDKQPNTSQQPPQESAPKQQPTEWAEKTVKSNIGK
jgi:hypothetical protein